MGSGGSSTRLPNISPTFWCLGPSAEASTLLPGGPGRPVTRQPLAVSLRGLWSVPFLFQPNHKAAIGLEASQAFLTIFELKLKINTGWDLKQARALPLLDLVLPLSPGQQKPPHFRESPAGRGRLAAHSWLLPGHQGSRAPLRTPRSLCLLRPRPGLPFKRTLQADVSDSSQMCM